VKLPPDPLKGRGNSVKRLA